MNDFENWPCYLKLKRKEQRHHRLRADNTKTNEVETGNIKGTFTFEAGSRFNDLPNQLRQIDCYEDFSKNARNFYYDCAMARILQESN